MKNLALNYIIYRFPLLFLLKFYFFSPAATTQQLSKRRKNHPRFMYTFRRPMYTKTHRGTSILITLQQEEKWPVCTYILLCVCRLYHIDSTEKIVYSFNPTSNSVKKLFSIKNLRGPLRVSNSNVYVLHPVCVCTHCVRRDALPVE